MTIENYSVQALFATPYFKANLSHAISPEHIRFIKNLNMIRNRDNMISENLYIFEEPELKELKDAVQEALNIYTSEVMGISQQLYVTQSWGLINHPGVGMHAHSHSNSIISGSLYYCELPDPPAKIVFDKRTSYQQLEFNPLQEKQNLFNTPVNVLTPVASEMLLFPSDLNHQIEANASNLPRYVVAFNTFLKGKIGNYRDVSELTL